MGRYLRRPLLVGGIVLALFALAASCLLPIGDWAKAHDLQLLTVGEWTSSCLEEAYSICIRARLLARTFQQRMPVPLVLLSLQMIVQTQGIDGIGGGK